MENQAISMEDLALYLEERKLTVMFELLMEQQQKRDEERGREAEERERG